MAEAVRKRPSKQRKCERSTESATIKDLHLNHPIEQKINAPSKIFTSCTKLNDEILSSDQESCIDVNLGDNKHKRQTALSEVTQERTTSASEEAKSILFDPTLSVSHTCDGKHDTAWNSVSVTAVLHNSKGELMVSNNSEEASVVSQSDVTSSKLLATEIEKAVIIPLPDFTELTNMVAKTNPYFKAERLMHDMESLSIVSTTNEEESYEASAPPISVEFNLCPPEISVVKNYSTELELNYSSPRILKMDSGEMNCKVKSLVLPSIETIQPYSESDLRGIYQNLQLENREAVVKKFINGDRSTFHHEFYELVQNYYRSRISQLSSHQDVLTLNAELAKQIDSAWQFDPCSIVEEGICEDDQTVEVKHDFKTAMYREDIGSNINKTMKQLREVVFETHSLHCYTSEMNRIHVENYIQKVITNCPGLQVLNKNCPVSCKNFDHPQELQPHIINLHACIAVLFAFQRRELKDDVFIKESRQWLTDLVALLLRIANIEDHYFLLNHVLRAPRGVASWAVQFIQVLPPHLSQSSASGIGSPLLDHSLMVLATLLSPVSGRASFLHNIRPSFLPPPGSSRTTNTGGEAVNENVWVVMDSSGEEEEDMEETWCNLDEQDIIDLVNQVPFEGLFRHILQLPQDCIVKEFYSVADVTPQTLLRLFAFCTALLRVFRTGLETYSSSRFKDLRKRLCRIVRHVIHYVSDHWSNYLHYHLWNVLPTGPPITPSHRHVFPSSDPIWTRLQVEYDQLFWRAVSSIVVAPKCWQFLAVIPYTAVSQHRLWSITYALHTGQTYTRRSDTEGGDATTHLPDSDGENSASTPPENWAALLRHADTQGRFKDRIMTLAPPQAFYLLTTFANMAISRPPWEIDFIEVVVRNVFELSVVCERTRDLCCKSGRDLLAAIAAAHPHTVLDTLLRATQENLSSVGLHCLLLYRHLPLHLWRPAPDHLHTLLYWLVYCPAASSESALARLLLARLDWGRQGGEEDGELVLPAAVHMQVALGIVNACVRAETLLGVVSPDAGGGGLFSGGVKTVTAVVYATPPEQQLIKWCWDQLAVLRLHRLDQLEFSSLSHSPASSPRDGHLSLTSSGLLAGVPDVSDSALLSVRTALLEHRHIALYFAVLATTWGHSVPEICEEGLLSMTRLAAAGYHEAVVTLLSCVTPLLWHTPNTVATDDRWASLLRQLLCADQSYYQRARSLVLGGSAGPVLQLLHAVVHTHVLQHRRYGLSCPTTPVLFWTHYLTALPGWPGHQGVLLLLDGLCRLLHRGAHHAREQMAAVLVEYAKSCSANCSASAAPLSDDTSSRAASVFRPITSLSSSVLSWLSLGGGGSCSPTSHLLPCPAPHLPWYTLLVLEMDTRWEDSTGLWKGVLRHLYRNPDDGLDAALKTGSVSAGVHPALGVNNLALYRWGQQVLWLSVTDPAFLATLQAFLTRHLSRVPPDSQSYACGSVIMRFYEGLMNSNFLNKIKSKVHEAVDYYKNREEEERKRVRAEETDELLLEIDDECYDSLPLLRELHYQHLLLVSMKAWLSEERLFQPGVFMTSMPPALNPTKLDHLLEDNWQSWEEVFSITQHQSWSSELLDKWHRHRTGRHQQNNKSSSSSTPSSSPVPVTDCDAATASLLPSAPLEGSHDAMAPSAPLTVADPAGDTRLPTCPGAPPDCLELPTSTPRSAPRLPPPCDQLTASIAKRLTEYDGPQPPPPLPCMPPTCRSPPSSPVLGMVKGTGPSKGLDRDMLVTDIQNYYNVVMSHAEVMVSRWRELCSSDCLILDLLPQLYRNVQRRTVRRQQCEAPDAEGGMGGGGILGVGRGRGAKKAEWVCAGAATVVLEFVEQQRSEGVSVRLEQLQSQRSSLLQQSTAAPPLQVCTAAAAIDTLVTALINEYRTVCSASPSTGNTCPAGGEEEEEERVQCRKSLVWECGWRLFWHVVAQATQENYYYPPAKQLTAATAAVLGQEFLSGATQCQNQVLSQVFSVEEAQGLLIAPHFSPHALPTASAVQLYRQLTHTACTNQDILFMLLSKFDLTQWRITDQESLDLLHIIYDGLQSLLGQQPCFPAGSSASGGDCDVCPDRDVSLVSGIYRVHWGYLLRSHFDGLYVPAVTLLLRMSSGNTEQTAAVVTQLWFDLLNSMATPAASGGGDDGVGVAQQRADSAGAGGRMVFCPSMTVPGIINEMRKMLQTQTILSWSLVESSLNTVSAALQQQRSEQALYGLFPLYRNTLLPVTAWCALTGHAAVYYTQHDDAAFDNVWSQLESLWSPWVQPYAVEHGRPHCPQWVLDVVGGEGGRCLLPPWGAADAAQANTALAFYVATLAYCQQAWRDRRCVLSRVLQRYCVSMADREVKEHVLTLLNTHLLSALPWHHLIPTIQLLSMLTKVINAYLPECHSFVGHVLVQVPWGRVVREAGRGSPCDDDAAADTRSDGGDGASGPHSPSTSPKCQSPFFGTSLQSPTTLSSPTSFSLGACVDPAKLHALLLNLLVRIAMEPSVRQSGPLHSLLCTAETFNWGTLDATSYEAVLNWYVQSCDPRAVLPLPGRSDVDAAVLHLLHVAASYTPQCGTFHATTAHKRALLVRALVRLLTSAAARHRALLTAQPGYFGAAYREMLQHMEDTVTATVSPKDAESAARPLCVELLAAVGHGAASPSLQEVCRSTAVQWSTSSQHPSSACLRALVYAAACGVLQLQHRTALLHAMLYALLHSSELGVQWRDVVSLLSFPATNPSPMIMHAAQEGELLLVYGYAQWRRCRGRVKGAGAAEHHPQLLQALVDGLAAVATSASSEKGFLLLLSEVLDMTSEMVSGGAVLEPWQCCHRLATLLAAWEEDRRSTGLLGSIGLGPRSDVAVSVRVISRSIRAFLLAQMTAPGVFCSVNDAAPSAASATSDVADGERLESDAAGSSSAGASLAALTALLALRSHGSYGDALTQAALQQAALFLQDSTYVITDAPKLLAMLVRHFYSGDLLLCHLSRVTSKGRFLCNVEVEHEATERRKVVPDAVVVRDTGKDESHNPDTKLSARSDCGSLKLKNLDRMNVEDFGSQDSSEGLYDILEMNSKEEL